MATAAAGRGACFARRRPPVLFLSFVSRFRTHRTRASYQWPHLLQHTVAVFVAECDSSLTRDEGTPVSWSVRLCGATPRDEFRYKGQARSRPVLFLVLLLYSLVPRPQVACGLCPRPRHSPCREKHTRATENPYSRQKCLVSHLSSTRRRAGGCIATSNDANRRGCSLAAYLKWWGNGSWRGRADDTEASVTLPGVSRISVEGTRGFLGDGLPAQVRTAKKSPTNNVQITVAPPLVLACHVIDHSSSVNHNVLFLVIWIRVVSQRPRWTVHPPSSLKRLSDWPTTVASGGRCWTP